MSLWRQRKREAVRKRAAQAPPIPTPPMTAPRGHQGPPLGQTGATGPTAPQFYNMFAAGYSARAASFGSTPDVEVIDKGFAIEPIVAWRAFGVKVVETLTGEPEYQLLSLNQVSWPARKPLEALCHGNLLADHDPPKVACTCGIYAWNREARANAYQSGNVIYGEVYLWGDVLICDYGYRAEIAYPKRLFIRATAETRNTKKVRAGLIKSYGIPVDYEPGTETPDEDPVDVSLMGWWYTSPPQPPFPK